MRRFAVLLVTVGGLMTLQSGGAAAAGCPNEALRIGASVHLPECRAYEMVSPVDKNGGNVGRVLTTKVAPSGDAATFYSAAAFAGSPSSALSTGYLSKRTATGWVTEALDPPQRNTGNSLLMSTVASTEDLSLSLSASDRATVPGSIEGGSNLYLRNNLTGTTTLAFADQGVRLAEGATGLNGGLFLGATPDWSHIVIRTVTPLTADTPPSNYDYLYDLSGGQMHLLNYRPDGTVETNGPTNTIGSGYTPYSTPISADGRRVFLQQGVGGGNGVFIREDDERTIPISVSEISGETKEGTLEFVNRAGTQVYFKSFYSLQAGAPSGALYRYDVGTEALTDLTPNAEEGNAQTDRVLGASADGSRVYFLAAGALGDGATKAGFLESNLYALIEGNLRFVGRTGNELPLFQASPDGRYLAFSTFSDPTGTKTTSPACGTLEGYGNPAEDCLDTYVYDSGTDQLSCVSCAVPNRGHTWLAGQESREPSIAQGTEFARALLEDGTVFVETKTRLVPRDQNGVMDVYGWRAGTPQLISTGEDPNPSWFGSASPDGRNVLFMTNQALVGADSDKNIDLYDARVEGGLASQWPPGSPPPCSGEACRSAAPTPPVRLRSGSSVATAGVCQEVSSRAAVKRAEARRLRRQAKVAAGQRAEVSGKRAQALDRKVKSLRHRAAVESRAAKRIQKQAKDCGGTDR